MAYWLTKGFWGIDMKKQTIAIAIFYLCLGLVGLITGFILIENPEKFLNADQEEMKRNSDKELSEEESSVTSSEVLKEMQDGILTSDERQHYLELIRKMQNEGVEVVVAALITMVFSVMLIIGVRKSKSVWFMPWLVQQSVELFLSLGFFIIRAISGRHFTFVDVFLFLCYLVTSSYFTYAVLSHYVLLRKMDKHANQIITSVMEGDSYGVASGVNYERLQEEVGKEMTTISMQPNPPVRDRPDENSRRKDDVMFFSVD